VSTSKEVKGCKRTWNHHGLATHDEDDLHWAKLWHVELTALVDGVAQLIREDATEEADGNGLSNVRLLVNMHIGVRGLKVEQVFDVESDEGSLVSNSEECHNGGCAHDDIALDRCRGNADDPDLHAERDHDENSDNERENVHGGSSSQVSAGDARPVSSQLSVRVEYRASCVAGEEDAADGVGDEAYGVDEEDVGLALICTCQEKEHQQEHGGCTSLSPVVGGQTSDEYAAILDQLHRNAVHAAIGKCEVEFLGEQIKLLWGCRCIHTDGKVCRSGNDMSDARARSWALTV
jgi:hypothetical protein